MENTEINSTNHAVMNSAAFHGSGIEYFKIWIVNILLIIVTLGIYYPWAKVRTRQYFYANTEFDGRTFEYHATGKQLLVGYLIAMGIFLAYTIFGEAFPIFGSLAILAFLAFFPWVIWRSLKFNARMTSFSNVRLGFNGQLKRAYFIYMLLPILGFIGFYSPIGMILAGSLMGTGNIPSLTSILFLGVIALLISFAISLLIGAYTKKASAQYTLGKLTYGQGEFDVDIQVKEFIKITLKSGLLAIGMLVFIGFASSLFLPSLGKLEELVSLAADPTAGAMVLSSLGGVMAAIYFLFIVGSFTVIAYFYTRQRKYVYDNTTFDNRLHFDSSLTMRSYLYVMVTNFLITIFTLGLGRAWAKVRMAKLIVENTWVGANEGTDFDKFTTQKAEEQSALGDQIGDVMDVNIDIAL